MLPERIMLHDNITCILLLFLIQIFLASVIISGAPAAQKATKWSPIPI